MIWRWSRDAGGQRASMPWKQLNRCEGNQHHSYWHITQILVEKTNAVSLYLRCRAAEKQQNLWNYKRNKNKITWNVSLEKLWGKCWADKKRSPEIRISHSWINICEQIWWNAEQLPIHESPDGLDTKTKRTRKPLKTRLMWHMVI